MSDVVSLSTESARIAFAVRQIMDYSNSMIGRSRSKLNSVAAQKRIERAQERMMRVRQDLAALLHEIDPENHPHPSDKGASFYYSFPRELKKEAP